MIGAIVLAAGASSRMGRAKALLTVGTSGLTFLDAIERTLTAAGLRERRVVVSPELASLVAFGVVNPHPSAGMLSSLQCGLRALPPGVDGALVWPVDHPLVLPETVLALVAAFHERDAPIVVPTHGGRRGHPVLFAARLFPELLAADPSAGARAVVHAHADRIELPVQDVGVTQDIDTPEDYERALRALTATRPEVP